MRPASYLFFIDKISIIAVFVAVHVFGVFLYICLNNFLIKFFVGIYKIF